MCKLMCFCILAYFLGSKFILSVMPVALLHFFSSRMCYGMTAVMQNVLQINLTLYDLQLRTISSVKYNYLKQGNDVTEESFISGCLKLDYVKIEAR